MPRNARHAATCRLLSVGRFTSSKDSKNLAKALVLGPEEKASHICIRCASCMPPCNVVSVLQDGAKVDLSFTTPRSRMRFPSVFVIEAFIYLSYLHPSAQNSQIVLLRTCSPFSTKRRFKTTSFIEPSSVTARHAWRNNQRLRQSTNMRRNEAPSVTRPGATFDASPKEPFPKRCPKLYRKVDSVHESTVSTVLQCLKSNVCGKHWQSTNLICSRKASW